MCFTIITGVRFDPYVSSCRRSHAGITLTLLPQVSVLIIPQAVKDRRKSGLSDKPPHDDVAEDEAVGQHRHVDRKNIIKL